MFPERREMITLDIKVTQDYIDDRDEKATIYNPGNRSEEVFLKDIECELLEYTLIKRDKWRSCPDDWRIDAVDPILGAIDVKFIKKWYNISCKKYIYLNQQRGTTDAYVFAEWLNRPTGLLKAGDEVCVNILGWLPYETALSQVQVSGYNGFYLDARKAISSLGTVFSGPFYGGKLQ